MSDESIDTHESECSICYADHDEEIHQATIDIHRWFRQQVRHEFAAEEIDLAEAV